MDKLLYQERLHEYYKNPRHKGTLISPDFESGTYNPSCGDAILFQGHIRNNSINAIAFDGKGCVISLATASMLAELAQGKSIQDVMSLTTRDMQELVALELGPTRLRCALLSLEALQKGLKQYNQV